MGIVMVAPIRRRATYADVVAAPRHLVAEIIDGDLRLSPRPAGPHTLVATLLGSELGPPFHRGRGGPGGWLILGEPELHLGEDILVPDLAGWRRERMSMVADVAFFEIAPDWVCEVLSPSTEQTDRAQKLALYASTAVNHAWLVNPRSRTLEVMRRQERHWLTIGVHKDDDRVRAEPFDAIELDLSGLWADLAPSP
jgi:Uma2 family endonuclease